VQGRGIGDVRSDVEARQARCFLAAVAAATAAASSRDDLNKLRRVSSTPTSSLTVSWLEYQQCSYVFEASATYFKIRFLHDRKYTVSITNTNRLMLFRERIAA
jgi:hypothetical protein